MDVPVTRYAKTAEGLHIAYQVVGEGPHVLIFLPEWISNVELQWQEARHARFLNRLASLARLVVIDRRGTGLSDRISTATPSLEASMDDVLAVMSDADIERATLFGVLEGGCIAAVVAASHPDMVDGLVMHGAYATGLPAADYPWAWTEDDWREEEERIERMWGTDEYADSVLDYTIPDSLTDEVRAWWRQQSRLTMSPAASLALTRMQREIDLRRVLPLIQVPTLVLQRTGDQVVGLEEGRYLARSIPGATFVELPGRDHPPWAGDQEPVLREIERFLGSMREDRAGFDRVLATVMFTDVVDSTALSVTKGDTRWRDVMADHDRIVRAQLSRYHGIEVKTMGDGFLATFDGPGRAVRCARAIIEQVRSLDIELRVGLHAGEVELAGNDPSGVAVAIGARVGSIAAPSEALVTSTVRDLTAGSGLVFEDAGEHELKGIPDRWRLYRVVG